MLERQTVASVRMDDGSEFQLARDDDDWIVSVDGRVLMSNRVHDSEEALAERAVAEVDDPHRVLVGGLGLGYTLRTVLDCVPDDAEVTVAEIVPALVVWNRVYLGHLADHPLDDPRCSVVVGDVFDVIARSPRTFDVILLDVDNGPEALAQVKNHRLYGDRGTRAIHAALRPGGVVAVWSAGQNPRYAQRLERLGFHLDVVRVAAHVGSRARHVLFIAKRLGRA